MRILTDDQRAKLLKVLNDAPDSVLCDAVVELKRYRIQIQDTYKECAGYIGRDEIKLKPEPPVPDSQPPLSEIVASTRLKPETAPGVACSRAGKDTVDAIKARCMKPSTLDEINKFLKRSDGKKIDTQSILKLLWDRGALVYEGGTYRNK